MSNVTQFVLKGRQLATTAAALAEDMASWKQVYWDRGYNAGGAAEISQDQQLEGSGVTVADLTGLVTFVDAFETFLVANRAYLSKTRSDL